MSNKYSMDKYIKDSARTLSSEYLAINGRMSSEESIDLLHAAMGLSTESNEILDHLKKVFFYGKLLDKVNLAEEVGDILWYCSIMCRRLGLSFEQIAETNIKKLQARYPEKFTEENALVRDLDTERGILEKMDGENEAE